MSAVPTGPVPLAEWHTACPTPGFGAADRLDPYWTGMWSSVGGAEASWLSRRVAERRARDGLGSLPPAARRWSSDEALDLLVTRNRQQRLSALAAVGLWRTLTVEQLVAVTGNPRLAGRGSRDLALLWAAGLIHRGTLPTGLSSRGRSRRPAATTVVRPELRGPIEQLSTRMSYREWVGVTAGSIWSQGSQFDRHNLLASELSLRAAEFCPLTTVLGEALASWKLMVDPSARVPEHSQRAADAAWVRPDGLVIAVELTAKVSAWIRAKAQAWADVLAQDTSKSLVVLFVEATHPDRGDGHKAINLLRKAVAAAAYSSMDTVLAGVAERMAVASWSDWFPQPGLVIPGWPALPVVRPTGPDGARWEPAHLLDPSQVVFNPRADATSTAVIDNANLLYGVPHWLRTGPGPDLVPLVRARAGLPITRQSAA